MDKAQFDTYELPDSPGVYFFLGHNQEILYIGKATSLRNRVRSYFTDDIKEKRSSMIEGMVEKAESLDYTETDSVLEALILETNLIRTHKPTYNTRSKDDKSYNHLVITNEKFPRVLVVRGKDLTEKFTAKEIKYHFGPFPSGKSLREALKIVRKLFKFYDTKKPVGEEKSKMVKGQINFNRQIGLYPDEGNREEYLKHIRHLRLFFEGKKHKIVRELEKEMHSLAKQEKFEEAERVKQQIFSLKHIQDVALLGIDQNNDETKAKNRIEAYDVAHISGSDMVGVMVVVENNEAKKEDYRKFKINTVKKANDTKALQEMLERRLEHPEWPYPKLIVVDGGKAQKNTAELVLRSAGLVIPVVAVVKNEKHKPERLITNVELSEEKQNAVLLANAEAHRFALKYHQDKRKKGLLR